MVDIIVVAGKAKGVGKTTLIAMILKNLKGKVGVIKTSIHEEFGCASVSHSRGEAEANCPTDTSRFLDNGAAHVVFVKSDYGHLAENLTKAMEALPPVDYLVVEGNRVLNYVKASLVIYLTREDAAAKPWSFEVESRADVVIDYNDLNKAVTGEIQMKEMHFDLKMKSIDCYKAHLLSHVLGIELSRLGAKLDAEGVKLRHCQLGVF